MDETTMDEGLGTIPDGFTGQRMLVVPRTAVAALAAMVGLSPSQLTALFRERLGGTPLQFQVQLRMTPGAARRHRSVRRRDRPRNRL